MSRVTIVNLVFSFLSMAMLSGCSINPAGLHHAQSENNDIEVYGTSAGIRGILLRKKSSATVYCAEPQPDATVNESLSENVSISQATAGNESEGVSESESEKSLGGRSVNVLITREIFYRTCEFLANTELKDDDKLKVFTTSLQSIIDLNRTNLGVGTNSELNIETNAATSIATQTEQVSDNQYEQGDALNSNDSLDGN